MTIQRDICGIFGVALILQWPAQCAVYAQSSDSPAANVVSSAGSPGPSVAADSAAKSIDGSSADAHSQSVAMAEDLYRLGDFEQSQWKLEPLILNLAHLDAPIRQRVIILGIRLAFAFDRGEDARPWMISLEQLAPDFFMDPIQDPPAAHSMWEEIRVAAAAKRAAEKAAVAQSLDATDAGTAGADEPEQKLRSAARFWVSLLPFGVGHFDHGRFTEGFGYLGAEVLTLYVSPYFRGIEKSSPRYFRERSDTLPNRASELLFMGTWGYEVLDLVPELMRRDARRAEYVRYGLSFFPFGVGQMKNGEMSKAVGFAVAEGALIGYGLLARSVEQRRLAMNIAAATILYGAFDGWVNHRSLENRRPPDSQAAPRVLLPILAWRETGNHFEFALAYRQSF